MTEFNLTFNDVQFDINAEWHEYIPATYLQPEEGGYYIIDEIYWNGHDVTGLFYNPEKLITKKGDDLFFGKINVNDLYFLLEIEKPWVDIDTEFNNTYKN
jgi:hypothetical protein